MVGRTTARLTSLTLILFSFSACIDAQTYFCKAAALVARKNIPKLDYKCREDIADYGSEVLRYPERAAAVNRYTRTLETFNRRSWWASTVDDLTFCDVRRRTGRLTKDQIGQLNGGDYLYRLFGNAQTRVVMTADPCYQTGYGGSNIFLLSRASGKVKATEIIDGFSSRADNPIFVNFANLNGEQIVEIASSTGGLNPMVINYYFSVDRRTGKASPKKLFMSDKGLTHIVTSMMLLAEPEEYGLPPKSEPLVVIKNGRLARSFSVFDDVGETTGTDNHARFTKATMRWNGRYYK